MTPDPLLARLREILNRFAIFDERFAGAAFMSHGGDAHGRCRSVTLTELEVRMSSELWQQYAGQEEAEGRTPLPPDYHERQKMETPKYPCPCCGEDYDHAKTTKPGVTEYVHLGKRKCCVGYSSKAAAEESQAARKPDLELLEGLKILTRELAELTGKISRFVERLEKGKDPWST